jgi:hypothetical protein
MTSSERQRPLAKQEHIPNPLAVIISPLFQINE